MCSVCVCVRIHTPTPTYTPTRVKIRKDTDNTPVSPSVINNLPLQATIALIDYFNPPTLVPQRWMNTLRMHERICALCIDCVRKCVC